MLLHHCCPVVGLIVPRANVHPVTLRSARDKLLERRNRLIEDVIKHDPDYKPPADYKPRKFVSKVYIPINEFPGYNFIGECVSW